MDRPGPAGRGRGALHYLGPSGGASASQSRRSFSFALGATHPDRLPARGRRGRRRGETGPLPHPRPSPALGTRYVTCPALPAPRSPRPRWARPARVPLPGRTRRSPPGRLTPPLSCWGAGREKRGKWQRRLGRGELTDKIF